VPPKAEKRLLAGTVHFAQMLRRAFSELDRVLSLQGFAPRLPKYRRAANAPGTTEKSLGSITLFSPRPNEAIPTASIGAAKRFLREPKKEKKLRTTVSAVRQMANAFASLERMQEVEERVRAARLGSLQDHLVARGPGNGPSDPAEKPDKRRPKRRSPAYARRLARRRDERGIALYFSPDGSKQFIDMDGIDILLNQAEIQSQPFNVGTRFQAVAHFLASGLQDIRQDFRFELSVVGSPRTYAFARGLTQLNSLRDLKFLRCPDLEEFEALFGLLTETEAQFLESVLIFMEGGDFREMLEYRKAIEGGTQAPALKRNKPTSLCF